MATLDELSERLARVEAALGRIEERIHTWESLLPDPDSLAGRALARRLRRQGAEPRSAVEYLGNATGGNHDAGIRR